MGRIVVTEFVTVDGVMEGPGGDDFARGGWAFKFGRGEDGDRFKLDELMGAEAHLLGRVTYEGFAAAWPDRTDEAGFADRINSMPKYVVSNTLGEATWQNTTVLRGDAAAEVGKLKERLAGDILVAGSGTLVRTMAEHDLVDQYRLMVFPILIGAGRRLFGDLSREAGLKLVEFRKVGDQGVTVQVFEPIRG